MIDSDKSSRDLVKVFGRFRFPYIVWSKTKSETAKDFKRLGFESSLGDTWFCFTPVDEKPCGTCNPCITAIEDGMKWRLSKEALCRYRMQKIRIGLNGIKRIMNYPAASCWVSKKARNEASFGELTLRD